MQFKDYYATLGVEPDAPPDEVKRAYRKLARKYHPDLNREPGTEARFKDLAEAYEVIGDVERRARYDAMARQRAAGQSFEPSGWTASDAYGGGTAGSNAGGEGPRDFSDFFASMFGRAQGARGAGSAVPPSRDRHARVRIGIVDSYLGARRTVTLREPNGTGGTVERQLEINIPKGVREGQQLRLAGQGDPGRKGAGDLLLEVSFEPHPHFRVEGRDVYLELPITPWEAALGATIAVPLPDGPVQLSVPPASATGRKLRLRGKGLPGKTPGDLYAVLNVTAPPASTTDAREAYLALARAFPDFNPRGDVMR